MSRPLPQNEAATERGLKGTRMQMIAVVCTIVALGTFATITILPDLYGKKVMSQKLSNLRQLYMVTKQMTLDNQTSGTPPVAWTCDGTTPLTYAQWKKDLTAGYLMPQDLEKLLTLPGPAGPVTDAITVFAVTDSDPGNTVLFASKNWRGPQSGPLATSPSGDHGFTVFRKDGSSDYFNEEQAADVKLIGSGGMHGFLPLK